MPSLIETHLLDDTMTFRPAAIAAVRAFRESHPWRGSIPERVAKLRLLNRDLARAYRMRIPRLSFILIGMAPAHGQYSRLGDGPRMITLTGHLSVVTYLHEFAHARGMDERQALAWSINLFRRMFPISYASCRHDGTVLVQDVPVLDDLGNPRYGEPCRLGRAGAFQDDRCPDDLGHGC